MIVYGINPVLEALRSGRAERLEANVQAASPRVLDLVERARRGGVPVVFVEPDVLRRRSRGGVHQGVVAVVRAAEQWTPESLVDAAAGVPLVIVLDGIEDPHNLGAILRTADAAGASGVVRQTRRAAPLGGAAAKASAGAVAHVRVADVVNVSRALEVLKARGVWTVGLSADAPVVYDRIDYRQPTAFVLGAEGAGLRRLVRERCDWLVAIPLVGHVASLNVSVAAGIVLFEALRQRRDHRASRVPRD
jgi:23S rRNA (guanosine2251-2'-O)-methyltransferase